VIRTVRTIVAGVLFAAAIVWSLEALRLWTWLRWSIALARPRRRRDPVTGLRVAPLSPRETTAALELERLLLPPALARPR
jgi:hypothetical protein